MNDTLDIPPEMTLLDPTTLKLLERIADALERIANVLDKSTNEYGELRLH